MIIKYTRTYIAGIVCEHQIVFVRTLVTCQSACNALGVCVLHVDQETCFTPSGCPYRSPCIGEARQSNKHRAVTLRHRGSVCTCVFACLFLISQKKFLRPLTRTTIFFLIFFLLKNQKIFKKKNFLIFFLRRNQKIFKKKIIKKKIPQDPRSQKYF